MSETVETRQIVSLTVLQEAAAIEPAVVRDEDLPDEEVMRRLEMALEALDEARDMIKPQIERWERQLLQRLQSRGARAIPHPQYECERKDLYSTWDFDIPTLQELLPLLTDDERPKVLKYIEETVHVVPAHWEPGNPRSIESLAKKYAGSRVAELIEKARSRKYLGEKLLFKRRSA